MATVRLNQQTFIRVLTLLLPEALVYNVFHSSLHPVLIALWYLATGELMIDVRK
jgi:hypothetical protein